MELKSVTRPKSPFEGLESAPVRPASTPGFAGSAPDEASRSVRFLAVKGRSGPIHPPFESVIGRDERVRIVDTELSPWRMICSLEMRGPTGASAIGTGWLVGPRTVLTAGHCVFSNFFFGGWAASIDVIPGRNGFGPPAESEPFGRVTSTNFSSVDRWQSDEDPDFDIGCIHLEEPLGETVGWFPVGVRTAGQFDGLLVNVSGYPSDRGDGTAQYHGHNRVLRVSDRRLFYEVDTFGGQSGGPVWIYEDGDTTRPVAVGVHAYGTGGTPADLRITANSAPRFTPEVLALVTDWVGEDGGWPSP
ncbi:trypsin-like serine protease [Actinoplanes sp. NEAU-A12]|uniref:Serine protease n=1 Tax=Actinoplanes sandaracinus TaxID=3045177 RepID=A0ABT6WSF1_9ACTN|nr:trypsin-like serine protease [Actinoplanes sandaracinus]MDI6102662.1 trypsin-like serine protease [Actinoplanes sandaracinus]